MQKVITCWNCESVNIKKIICDSCKQNYRVCYSWICQKCGENVTDYTHDN